MAAVTVSDLQTSLAYRLGEDSTPSSTAEQARRLSFINEAYRAVIMRHYWWFTETTSQFSTVAGQESYGTSDGVPTNLRTILELRYNNVVYQPITQTQALASYTVPYTNGNNNYFVFNSKIYPVPAFPATVANGVQLKYFAGFTKLTSNSDTVLIPEAFCDVLVAYAFARFSILDSERGNAADGFDEFNEIMSLMEIEQNKYNFALKDNNDGDYGDNFYS